MKRRDFLKIGTLGTLSLAIMPQIMACSNVSRDSYENSPNLSKLLSFLGKEKCAILEYASLAPSSHNVQPWQILIIDDSNFIISIDKSRIITAVDPKMREIYISLGTFLANMEKASISYGYDFGYNINNTDGYTINVQINKNNQIVKNANNLERIKLRRTLRKNYLNSQISENIFTDIFDNNLDNFSYHPLESKIGKIISNSTIEANILQTNNNISQKELAEWIRWSNTDIKNHNDGLTPASMEIDGIAGLFVRSFYNKDDVMSESFRNKTISMVCEQVSQGSGWIVLTSDDNNIPTLINSGYQYENAMIKIREHNIAFHPMSQAIEEAKVYNELKSSLNINNNIQFVIRTGYVKDYREPVSVRRSIDKFSTFNN